MKRTPWTVLSNLAAAVNHKIKYDTILDERKNKKFILAEEDLIKEAIKNRKLNKKFLKNFRIIIDR